MNKFWKAVEALLALVLFALFCVLLLTIMGEDQLERPYFPRKHSQESR